MNEPRSRAHLKYLEWWHSAGCVGQSAAGNWIAEIEAERDAMVAALRKYHAHLPDCNLARPCSCGFDAVWESLTSSETKPESFPVPSGWRGQKPWFEIGDHVLPTNALYRFYPVHTVTEITERGFKYTHERMNLFYDKWSEGGETFEPTHYELAASTVNREGDA
jgi:hypothetical protein